jgi:hypothetical protein
MKGVTPRNGQDRMSGRKVKVLVAILGRKGVVVPGPKHTFRIPFG